MSAEKKKKSIEKKTKPKKDNITKAITKTKEKIEIWLKEEGLTTEEAVDENTHFNIMAKNENMGFNVVQSKNKKDSFIVGTNLFLPPEAVILLKEMGKEKKEAFLWDLSLTFLKNNELGEFEIRPNPPDDIQVIFVSSRPIFYEALSKGTLISAANTVMKATLMAMWLLNQHSSVTPTLPKKDQKLSYAT